MFVIIAKKHHTEQGQPAAAAISTHVHAHIHASLSHLLTSPIRLCPPRQTITGSEYATLATITAEGLPTARTVWIRQLYQSRALLITTDSRSAKVSQLCRPHHLASIAYYLPLAKEQYRLTCQPTLLTHTTSHSTLAQLRSTVWQQSPDWLHDAFNQPPPGQPVGSSSGSGGGGGGGSSGVSEWFVVVLLWPIRCDYLRLPVTVIDNSKPLHRESRMKPQKEQQRWLHIRDAQTALWTITELNS